MVDFRYSVQLLACAGSLFAACLLTTACRKAPADPVLVLLESLEQATEARDADAMAQLLAPDFEASHGLKRAETVAQVRRYFTAYESIAVDVSGIETSRDGEAASVRCLVEFSGRARKLFGMEGLLPPEAVYRFELDVLASGGTWLVGRARWEPVTGGGDRQQP